jgi:hypothetical protein
MVGMMKIKLLTCRLLLQEEQNSCCGRKELKNGSSSVCSANWKDASAPKGKPTYTEPN